MGCVRVTGDASQSGFTLLEILLVITLIAVASAMIAPSFISMSDVDVSDEARRLQQVLRLASEEAQLTGIPVRLTVLKDRYKFEALNNDQSWGDFLEPPFKSYQLPSGIEMVAIHFAGGSPPERPPEEELKDEGKDYVGRIVFWPDGMLDAADMLMGQSDGGSTISLQLRSGPGGIRAVEEAP